MLEAIDAEVTGKTTITEPFTVLLLGSDARPDEDDEREYHARLGRIERGLRRELEPAAGIGGLLECLADLRVDERRLRLDGGEDGRRILRLVLQLRVVRRARLHELRLDAPLGGGPLRLGLVVHAEVRHVLLDGELVRKLLRRKADRRLLLDHILLHVALGALELADLEDLVCEEDGDEVQREVAEERYVTQGDDDRERHYCEEEDLVVREAQSEHERRPPEHLVRRTAHPPVGEEEDEHQEERVERVYLDDRRL